VRSLSPIKQLYKLGVANVAHSNAIISNGLVGYWTFDGSTINWSNSVVSDLSNTMGASGTLQTMTKNSAAAGKIGQALNFNRSSTQYVSMSSSTLFRLYSPFSFSVWVNAADIPSGTGLDCNNYYTVLGSDAAGWGWDLTLGDGTTANIFNINRYSDANNELVQSNSTYVAGKWYHVVGVLEATKTSIYVNGKLDNTSVPSENTFYYPNTGSYIGYETCGRDTESFNGKIDDVRIYNRALSATEIRQLYNAGR